MYDFFISRNDSDFINTTAQFLKSKSGQFQSIETIPFSDSGQIVCNLTVSRENGAKQFMQKVSQQ